MTQVSPPELRRPPSIRLEREPPRGPEPPRRTPPRWSVAAGTSALVVFAAVVLWLFGSAPPELARPANVESLPSVDGTLVVVDPPTLVMDAFRAVDGERRLRFTIREEDMAHFDVVHLRAHSSIGLPTRIYYEEEGGTLYAVYKEDAPANSRRDAETDG